MVRVRPSLTLYYDKLKQNPSTTLDKAVKDYLFDLLEKNIVYDLKSREYQTLARNFCEGKDPDSGVVRGEFFWPSKLISSGITWKGNSLEILKCLVNIFHLKLKIKKKNADFRGRPRVETAQATEDDLLNDEPSALRDVTAQTTNHDSSRTTFGPSKKPSTTAPNLVPASLGNSATNDMDSKAVTTRPSYEQKCIAHIESLDPTKGEESVKYFTKAWLSAPQAIWPVSADNRLTILMHDENLYGPLELGDTASTLPLIQGLKDGTEIDIIDASQYSKLEERVISRIEIIAHDLRSKHIIDWDKSSKLQKTKPFGNLWRKHRDYWGWSGERRRAQLAPVIGDIYDSDVYDISNIHTPLERRGLSALAMESVEDGTHSRRRKVDEGADTSLNKRQKQAEQSVALEGAISSSLKSHTEPTLDRSKRQEKPDTRISVHNPKVILESSHTSRNSSPIRMSEAQGRSRISVADLQPNANTHKSTHPRPLSIQGEFSPHAADNPLRSASLESRYSTPPSSRHSLFLTPSSVPSSPTIHVAPAATRSDAPHRKKPADNNTQYPRVSSSTKISPYINLPSKPSFISKKIVEDYPVLVRELEWRNERFDRRAVLGRRQYIESCLAHQRGEESQVSCDHCAHETRPSGPFTKCVTVDLFGECTNCHWTGHTRRCSLRPDHPSKQNSNEATKNTRTARTTSTDTIIDAPEPEIPALAPAPVLDTAPIPASIPAPNPPAPALAPTSALAPTTAPIAVPAQAPAPAPSSSDSEIPSITFKWHYVPLHPTPFAHLKAIFAKKSSIPVQQLSASIFTFSIGEDVFRGTLEQLYDIWLESKKPGFTEFEALID